MKYKDKIMERIDSQYLDQGFSVSDFLDICGHETVRSTLNRLVKSGKLRKIRSGVYFNPGIDEPQRSLGYDDVASIIQAIARKSGCVACPAGDIAAFLLGITNDLPPKWEFYTDWESREINIDGHQVKLTHIARSKISHRSKNANLVMQTILYIGEEKFRVWHLAMLRSNFTQPQLDEIYSEFKTSKNWVNYVLHSLWRGVPLKTGRTKLQPFDMISESIFELEQKKLEGENVGVDHAAGVKTTRLHESDKSR